MRCQLFNLPSTVYTSLLSPLKPIKAPYALLFLDYSMFILKWNKRWRHKSKTNEGNYFLQKAFERVCSGICLCQILTFGVKYFGFNLHLKKFYEFFFTFFHWRWRMILSIFAIFLTTRPTPISRVWDSQVDLEWLRIT